MTKHSPLARIVSAITSACLLAGGLAGCAHDAGVSVSGNAGFGAGAGPKRSPGTRQKIGEDNIVDGGSVAGGVAAPTGGGSTAALCFPSNSGPHQWPVNVYTAEGFTPSPDPKDTTVSVQYPNGPHDASRTYTIKVKGTVVQ